MLNATFQSHPIKMDCCSTNGKSLIVTTINPIWRSCPVHPGTKKITIYSLKSKENIIFAHNFTNPPQVHLYEKDDPPENQPPETPTQTMVHEC